MKMIKLCIAALLAVAVLVSTGYAASASMFSFPSLSIGSMGFGQISASDIGSKPIIFAPSNADLFSGNFLGTHVKPKLTVNNWTSSMKTSPVNQMFALMANGIGGIPAYG
ncbi:hypothetical protein MCP_1234 [Methanocella paludicola SANAE]|uniref:Uncharacterized protein n=1 Tax=Methanocella paludicola (strain DSM 17711 / JCM 13418 / NBRC 101707 / SANAE) TaxID=304371 RepID=D1YXY4_METPS|nr:hypothetical protein [Methanocella paludicola]BAI61306.1 hypothetical protein MCP_1234 [Methanocella paludicola SANAE]